MGSAEVGQVGSVTVTGAPVPGGENILTPEALAFVGLLQHRFGARRDELLTARTRRREEVARTGRLDFLPETEHIRTGDWTVSVDPEPLQDRRVEMTGPTDRKMTINALNSGAKVWLADMEDASTPHWANVVGGQISLFDAIRRQISFTNEAGKAYTLREDAPLATIVMRPRGWHFDESHIQLDGTPVVGALVDFGLYFFHNASELLARGCGPYFYLPKMESHLEARLWDEVFTLAESELGVPHGSVRATVLIETIPAAFEMDEILYELRDHASGLNAGRWDYLFSIIKYFRDSGPQYVLPDRNLVKMTAPFLKAYAELLVQTCHKRGAHAIGGMSAFIPSRKDAAVNERAFAQVTADKEREAGQGFDGSWVAHPDLVPVCRSVFDSVLGDRPNQLDVIPDVHVTADDLLNVAATEGEISEAGLRANIEVAVLYLESWLRGGGAVAIHNLMEDAATAEISRSQIWQWVNNGSTLPDGTVITADLVRQILAEELGKIESAVGAERFAAGQFTTASTVFESVALDEDYVAFLTLPAYAAIV